MNVNYPETVRKTCQEIMTQPADRQYSHKYRGWLLGKLQEMLKDFTVFDATQPAFETVIGSAQERPSRYPTTEELKDFRRLVLAWLLLPDSATFAPVHGSELQDNHYHALRRWIGEDNTPRRLSAKTEIHWILTCARWCMEHSSGLKLRELVPLFDQESTEPVEIDRGGMVDHTLNALGGDIYATGSEA